MTNKEDLRIKLKGLVGENEKFWFWYDNKFCKYDHLFDSEDIRVIEESLGEIIRETYLG